MLSFSLPEMENVQQIESILLGLQLRTCSTHFALFETIGSSNFQISHRCYGKRKELPMIHKLTVS